MVQGGGTGHGEKSGSELRPNRFAWAILTLLIFPCKSIAVHGPSRAVDVMDMPVVGKNPLIIFCHGSGDTGSGAEAWIRQLVSPSEFSRWDWIFPTAEPIPYSLNGGTRTSVWFDRIGGFDPSFPEHTESVERSTDRLLSMIREESERRDPGRIILGGFSMGGRIALQAAARWHATPDAVPLGGVFGLSCYLNRESEAWSMLRRTGRSWPRTFMAHGGSDDFILPQWGMATHEHMVEMGIDAEFAIIPSVYHDMTAGEMAQLLRFLRKSMEMHSESDAGPRLSQDL